MANDIRLSWPANPAEELVNEYHVFQGVNGGAMALRAVATGTSIDLLDLAPGVYRWAIKAANVAGISESSPETAGPAVPSAPGAPTVEVI